jgi:hypothetical protein
MNKLLSKIKNYFYKPINAEGEEFVVGVKTINPSTLTEPVFNSMRHGDRKRYFGNYNADLVNRISEIKSKNS